MSETCPECGGLHFGSARCPYSDPNTVESAAKLEEDLAAIREDERRGGNSKLVYNKVTRTIERAEPDPVYALAEAAYMFAGFLLSRKLDEEEPGAEAEIELIDGDVDQIFARAAEVRALAEPFVKRAAQSTRSPHPIPDNANTPQE